MEKYFFLQSSMAMNYPSRLDHVDIKVNLEPTLVCCASFTFKLVVLTIRLNLPFPSTFGLISFIHFSAAAIQDFYGQAYKSEGV